MEPDVGVHEVGQAVLLHAFQDFLQFRKFVPFPSLGGQARNGHFVPEKM